MKKNLLLVLFLYFVVVLNAQNVMIEDSAAQSSDSGKTYFPTTVTTYTYNNNCQVILLNYGNGKDSFDYYPDGYEYHSTSQSLNHTSGMYVNDSRRTTTYTADKQIASYLYENWKDSAWEASGLTTYTYNVNGKITNVLYQYPDSMGITFENNGETVNYYDGNGYLTKTVDKAWDKASNTWNVSNETDYYNNSIGLADSAYRYEPFEAITSTKSYFTYYPSSTLLLQETHYDSLYGMFYDATRATYQYDSLNNVHTESIIVETIPVSSDTFQKQSTTIATWIYNTDGTVNESDYDMIYPPGGAMMSVYAKDYYIYAPCSSALPLTLLSFGGQQMNNDALLQWQTTNEINTSYFNVQRSTDGVHFTTIGKVTALNNSSNQKSYSFTDANIAMLNAPKLYYRLASTDKDGTVAYSRIIELDIITNRLSVFISPNPIRDFINLYSPVAIPDAFIKITDMGGRVLYAATKNLQAGSHLAINASFFAHGMYIITVQSAIDKQEFKVVK